MRISLNELFQDNVKEQNYRAALFAGKLNEVKKIHKNEHIDLLLDKDQVSGLLYEALTYQSENNKMQRWQCVAWLIAEGAEPDRLVEVEGKSPLHVIAEEISRDLVANTSILQSIARVERHYLWQFITKRVADRDGRLPYQILDERSMIEQYIRARKVIKDFYRALTHDDIQHLKTLVNDELIDFTLEQNRVGSPLITALGASVTLSAHYKNQWKCAAWLIENGVDPTQCARGSKTSPLHTIAKRISPTLADTSRIFDAILKFEVRNNNSAAMFTLRDGMGKTPYSYLSEEMKRVFVSEIRGSRPPSYQKFIATLDNVVNVAFSGLSALLFGKNTNRKTQEAEVLRQVQPSGQIDGTADAQNIELQQVAAKKHL